MRNYNLLEKDFILISDVITFEGCSIAYKLQVHQELQYFE